MPRTDYGYGDLLLPSAADARAAQKALCDTQNGIRLAARQAVKRFESAFGGFEPARFHDRLHEWAQEPLEALGNRSSGLYSLVQHGGSPRSNGFDWALFDERFPAARATTRTFPIGGGSVSITGCELRWSYTGNNAHEHVMEDPVFRVIDEVLERVTFTEQSGGDCWSTDEYALDDYGEFDGWTRDQSWGGRRTESPGRS